MLKLTLAFEAPAGAAFSSLASASVDPCTAACPNQCNASVGDCDCAPRRSSALALPAENKTSRRLLNRRLHGAMSPRQRHQAPIERTAATTEDLPCSAALRSHAKPAASSLSTPAPSSSMHPSSNCKTAHAASNAADRAKHVKS
mgnify:CR=1 FL=1